MGLVTLNAHISRNDRKLKRVSAHARITQYLCASPEVSCTSHLLFHFNRIYTHVIQQFSKASKTRPSLADTRVNIDYYKVYLISNV